MNGPAPIALFVYNRPRHTERAVEALRRNIEFELGRLFVFCDAARGNGDDLTVRETRRVVHELRHPRLEIVEAAENKGLARSIVDGVTALCRAFGRVVVVEDDLIVSPVFLQYMNAAFNRYEDIESVMQLSGHMFPVAVQSKNDAVFLPFTTSWGWGTWARAWKAFDERGEAFDDLRRNKEMRRRFDVDGTYPYFRMLKRQRRGQVDSWAIRWYLSVFMRQGLTLYPCQSLVVNSGFDGTGTHCRTEGGDGGTRLRELAIERFPDPRVDRQVLEAVKAYFRRRYSPLARLLSRLNPGGYRTVARRELAK